MASDIPFVDIPATDKLTIRLELNDQGFLSLSIYYGGDSSDSLGTDDIFRWHGQWTDSIASILGHPPHVTHGHILEFMRHKLFWNDLMEETVDAFFASGALSAALRDARSHHLTLTVMGT